MHTEGSRRLVVGGIALIATVFVLPGPLFQVVTGADEGLTNPTFILGIVILAGGAYLVVTGLLARSRDLHTARTYDSLSYDTPGFNKQQVRATSGTRSGTGSGTHQVTRPPGDGCWGDIGGA